VRKAQVEVGGCIMLPRNGIDINLIIIGDDSSPKNDDFNNKRRPWFVLTFRFVCLCVTTTT
jgi:hypothetical protein